MTAAVTAWWSTGRTRDDVSRPSTVGDWAARAGMSPALVVGARLAVEPGRGRRAVPVRSALVGAIAGVLGIVACFTFRAGIDDALAQPERSGIVWDADIVSLGGPFDRETTITGLEGRDVNRIALRPVNDDARCSRVTATFANGATRELNIDDRDVLVEDRVFELDLPGARRDIAQIDMACHAENGGQVRMMVMANR